MGKYFCEKCNKNHFRGQIYKDHLKYKRVREKKKKIPLREVTIDKINLKTLRPIARRQIGRLLKKMDSSNNNELYKDEIKKIIIYEKGL